MIVFGWAVLKKLIVRSCIYFMEFSWPFTCLRFRLFFVVHRLQDVLQMRPVT